MDRVVVLLAVVALIVILGQWWKARDGKVRGAATRDALAVPDGSTGRWSGLPVEAADVVAALNLSAPLTFVEFTAPDCVPCAATAAVLDDVVAGRDQVAVVAVDVAEGLDLARSHRIMRAPTTMLISDQGHVLGRVSGVPASADLTQLLEEALPRDPVTC